MTALRLAVAACGAHWEPAVLAEIERDRAITLVRRCVDVADLLATIGAHRIDVALLAVQAPGLDAGVVARLVEAGVRPCAVEADGSALGIDHTARVGRLAELAAARIEPREEVVDGDGGRLVAVWGPTGAPGRSTLAVSICAATAAAGHATALVDADVHGGAIGQLLGVLDEVSGVMAACRDVDRGRVARVSTHLLRLHDSWTLLTGLPRTNMWRHVRTEALVGVLDALRRDHETVVVDLGFDVDEASPSSPGRIARRILELADEVVVVGSADPVGLARLVRALEETADEVSRPPRIVLNRFRATSGWSEREVVSAVRELAGRTPWAVLPLDQAAHDAAAMAGRPLREVAPTSRYVSRVERLAVSLATSR